MAVNNVTKQDDNGNKFETAKEIEINRSIVKFGTSVYQFKNVTGFEVGIIPKRKFPALLFGMLTMFGILVITIANVLSSIFQESQPFQPLIIAGFLALLMAIFILIGHVNQPIIYGLTIHLNSGQNSVFVSRDKSFLMKLVDSLYSFMKEEEEKSLVIDMSNRSITVGGSIHGSATAGDKNWM